jgi:hypothetical protein
MGHKLFRKDMPSTAAQDNIWQQRRILQDGQIEDGQLDSTAFMGELLHLMPNNKQMELFGELLTPLIDFRQEVLASGIPLEVDRTVAEKFLDQIYY